MAKKKKEQAAPAFSGATFDVEDGGLPGEYEEDFSNPLQAARPTPTEIEPSDAPVDAIAANESEMTEDELEDLIYAFQAADMDGGGAIDADEFGLMLKVMGCEITEEQIAQAIEDARKGFSEWLAQADEANRAKCQSIWDEYDDDKSGTMDLGEINNVVGALRKLGSDLPLMTAPEIEKLASRDDGELTFDEFCRWYLKLEGLPEEFSAPKKGKVGGKSKKEAGAVGKIAAKGKEAVMKPLAGLSRKAAAGPTELLKMSGRMKKQGQGEGGEDGELDDEETGREMMGEAGELNFGQYVFMMRGGALKEFLPGNWQERAEDMRKLREAFDTADVDGDNQLELEELEMVIVAMNPKANISPEDIQRVWAVLNPDGKEWIAFGEYVQGMIQVKCDPELSRILPMDVPNRFQLLSLLIDSPVNEDVEAQIKKKMGALERGGVRILESMGSETMSKDDIRAVLDQACAGKLHYLTDEQRKKVTRLHYSCVFQAFMLGMVTCAIAGAWENYMVMTLGTDGAKDAYFTCAEHFVDLEDPSSEYYNLSLPSNPGNWNGLGWAGDEVLWDTNSGEGPIVTEAYRQKETCKPLALEDPPTDCSFTPGDPASCGAAAKKDSEGCAYVQPLDPRGQCLPGTCTAYPRNVTAYLEMGGNSLMGGNWSWEMDDWQAECVPLQSTAVRDHELAAKFVVATMSMVVLMIVFELSGLMLTALRSAVKVSAALDLRLTPLNADRAFVATMLVRSVFELGDSGEDVMGVDAGGGEDEAKRPLWVTLLSVGWIKGRVLISGAVLKMVTGKLCNYDSATWMKPYSGTMLACMLWDAMLCHAIMKGAEVQAIGVTTSVEVFNEIMDTFCPMYEDEPETLSDMAKIQILRAIGVAIVKHGSMFPTMELLLRHAVNYLNMKKHKAVKEGGIIDDEAALLSDFSEITLDESRAVLCTHMLCYVLDGSIGLSETNLWHKLLDRVEECYQQERERVANLSAQELRAFIVMKSPGLETAVARVPSTGDAKNDMGLSEMEELQQIFRYVPMPEAATHFNPLVAKFVCQQFRGNHPVSTDLLVACFDPEANKTFMAHAMMPSSLIAFLIGEFTFTAMEVLCADPFELCWPTD
jgi:Ca2+-binding EF-hand superfamily protein